MTKRTFLVTLRNRCKGLPMEDLEERLIFYSEMIEDRMEEGYSEEEAVASVGDVNEIAAELLFECSLSPEEPKGTKVKGIGKWWALLLLVLGTPIWASLLISLFAVLFSLVASLWATFVAVVASSFAFTVSGIFFVCSGFTFSGLALLSAGLICTGLSIFLFFGAKLLTRGSIFMTIEILSRFKSCFTRKEDV